MVIRWTRFNIYFLAGAMLALAPGCHTEEAKTKKQRSTLLLKGEMNPDPMGHTDQISVNRQHPVKFTVSKDPFLTEAHVKEAKVVDAVGGFALRIQFGRQGSWLLEQLTNSERGKHIAIFSQWTDPPETKINQGRWLAAPRIVAQIKDGVLTFTPDATRYEAEQIARGLNNVAKKLETE